MDAELVGKEGVRALVGGETDKMVSLCSLVSGDEKAFKLVSLSDAGNSHRRIPADWLSREGQAVEDGFREYLLPLVGELSYYPAPLSTRRQHESA